MTGRIGLPDVVRDEGGNPPYAREHCLLCKRPLDVAGVEDSRDCGGDCWGCIRKIEEEAGYIHELEDPDLRIPAIPAEPTVGAENFLVQAEAALRIMDEVMEEHEVMEVAAKYSRPACEEGEEASMQCHGDAGLRTPPSPSSDVNADLVGFVIPNVGTVLGTAAWSDGMYVAVDAVGGGRTCRLAGIVRSLKVNATSTTMVVERGGNT